jgi:hypothetical protein
LARNDSLINNFEEHVILANDGNIDWRPLLNLWSVLEYLTKYNAKSGKASTHLGKMFEDVLNEIHRYAEEDGIHDLWRRTITKFYSRILGDRDYSLLEVLHNGLRLPAVLSSFTDVQTVSVSNWAPVKSGWALRKTEKHERVTWMTKLEQFNYRAFLELPSKFQTSFLENLSFYCFWRLYDIKGKHLVRRRREKMISINGAGWPTHASRSHPLHEDYARKTLYSYMPCTGLRGTDYIDEVVASFYDKSWSLALEDFVTDVANHWCPPWIRRNYEIRNKEVDLADAPVQSHKQSLKPKTDAEVETTSNQVTFPHSEKNTTTFTFEGDGEPPDAEEPDKPEAYTTDYHWKSENYEAWQMHSSWGPNLEAAAAQRKEEPLSELVNPLDGEWDIRLSGFDVDSARRQWETVQSTASEVSTDEFTLDKLNDDYQSLFVHMVLDHVDALFTAWETQA